MKAQYFVMVAALMCAGTVHASKADVKIGVVDMQTALQTVESGRKAKSTLESSLNKKKEELEKEGKALEKMSEEYQKQALVLSEPARAKKEQELKTLAMKFEQKKMQTQMMLQQKERDLTGPIVRDLRKVIEDLANKGGYTVILEKNENSVLYSLSKDDLTNDVIKEFNKKF